MYRRMLNFLVCVTVAVVFWSVDTCRGWGISPHVARVKVIYPIFDCTHSACNDLSHSAFTWSYSVAARIRVQQVVHEIAGQTTLLYRLQWHTDSLLNFEDESLSRLCPRVVFFRGVFPEILWRQEASTTQLTDDWSLHYSSPSVGVL